MRGEVNCAHWTLSLCALVLVACETAPQPGADAEPDAGAERDAAPRFDLLPRPPWTHARPSADASIDAGTDAGTDAGGECDDAGGESDDAGDEPAADAMPPAPPDEGPVCQDAIALTTFEAVSGTTTASPFLTDYYEYSECYASLPGYERLYTITVPAQQTLRARVDREGMAV